MLWIGQVVVECRLVPDLVGIFPGLEVRRIAVALDRTPFAADDAVQFWTDLGLGSGAHRMARQAHSERLLALGRNYALGMGGASKGNKRGSSNDPPPHLLLGMLS